MVKKILSILLWIVTAAAMVVLFVFARKHYQATPVHAINLQQSSKTGFVVHKDLYDEIAQICQDKKAGTVDMIAIRNLLNSNPWIESNASYIDLDGTLNVNFKEFEPQFRVFDANGRSAYVTIEGTVIPSSRTYTPHVLVASGNFVLRLENETYKLDTIEQDNNIRDALHWFKAIGSNEFIKNCIGQLYCNHRNQFELTMKGLEAQIIVGDTCDASDKLHRLEIFIKQRLSHPETHTLKSINLNYKNQIVCTKR